MRTIKELISLKDRTVLITGATGNLGRTICHCLAELGANLLLVDKPNSNFASLSSNLVSKWGVEVEYFFCDLELPKHRAELISKVINAKNSLNCLINNAAFVGTSDLDGWIVPFEQQTVETFNRAIELNLTAVFDLCKGFSPLLKKSEGANIINICSIYGMYAPDWNLYKGTEMGSPAAYGASKAGLLQLTRWLSTTLAPNVRVNAVSPGGIFRDQPKEFVVRYEEKTPLGRMATEDDLIGAISYLASDLSKYVTGQNLSVDGGWGVV